MARLIKEGIFTKSQLLFCTSNDTTSCTLIDPDEDKEISETLVTYRFPSGNL